MRTAAHPLLPLPVVDSKNDATIECVAAVGPLRARLSELGLIPGARIRVLHQGSPCILLVSGGARLCLRADEADAILVQVA